MHGCKTNRSAIEVDVVVKAMTRTLFLMGLFFSSSTFATKACPTLKVEQGIGIVSAQCPIGEGLWSKKPSPQGGAFWVQCGILDNLPSVAFRQSIEKHIANNADWVLKPEEKGFRCLLGPYQAFNDAVAIRDKIRQEPVTSDAFIRQIDYPEKSSSQSTKAQPSTKKPKQTLSKGATVRKLDSVVGLWTPKPKGDDARYSIHQRDWWRATYLDAKKACTQSGKRLASESAIRRAVSRQGAREQFPATIPYWLSSGNVYDIKLDMAFVAISDTLTLNVLCE
ncbi:SPOR domain-containing protein [Enterovibrio sp. FF113]|uniref:SPOR domain-containing protein n=1 Tax=Enterovibrio sp. FF113 TaxID=3230010 RepID=UPI00352F0571